jgi:hypothetical protein
MNLLGHFRRLAEPRWFETPAGRAGQFDAVAASGGKSIPVLGTRLAREGLAFISAVKLREREVPLRFTIRRRTIPSRVKILKDEMLHESSRVVHRYFCAFTYLDEVDREIVSSYVDDVPDPEGPLVDARRALSPKAQAKVAERLVSMRRLAPPEPGLAPLVRLEASPVRELDDGRALRIVTVHSRICGLDGVVRSFTTRFRVYSDDHVEVEH